MALPGVPAEGADPGNRYVVMLDETVRASKVLENETLVKSLNGPAFHGAVAQLTSAQADQLRDAPGVLAVERDRPVSALSDGVDGKRPLKSNEAVSDDQHAAAVAQSWGLDRTDQRTLPLNGDYSPPSTGTGVDAYILDTGLNPGTDFIGRVGNGAYVSSVASDSSDCNGHGTHVTGTIGSTTYGMAPGVVVHPVRVLNCAGSGTTSATILGINWVAANAPTRAVVNLSLGGSYSAATNAAMRALVDRGLVVAVAAGNDGDDACYASPASEPSVLTVGAVDSDDYETYFSNYGPCLDLYAPGEAIVSTNYLGGAGVTKDGTSMASPHVAGAAALYWEIYPQATGGAVQQAVMSQATSGILTMYEGLGSPNLYLNVQYPVPVPPVAPSAVVATAGNAAATVSWQPPSTDGGSLITGYTVVTSSGQPGCTVVASNSCTVPGLANGTAYSFAVSAQNAKGSSPLSAWSAAVVPATVPGASTQVKAKAGKRTAKVRWSAASNGGAQITSYRVSAKPGGRSCVTAGTKCTVKKLKKGKRYRFTVTASNALGSGPTSAPSRKVRIR